MSVKKAPPAGEARVLLIEEQASNIMITRRLLERFGIGNVFIASNGTVGLNMLKESKPDLILMDCTMHGLDGYDAARLIRMKETEAGSSNRIPIIGMTANTSNTAMDHCLQSGMNGCAHKPIDPAEMHELLSQYIQMRGYKLPQIEASEMPPQDERIDMRVVAQFARAGREPLHMLIHAYIDETSDLIATLRDALVRGDHLRWAQTIHTLRGASANIGALEMVEMASHSKERLPEREAGEQYLIKLRESYNFVHKTLEDYLAAFD